MALEGTYMARVVGYNEHATTVNQTFDGRKKLTVVTRMEVSEGRAFIAGVVDGLRYVSRLPSADGGAGPAGNIRY